MRRIGVLLLAALLLGGPSWAADEANPHHMTKPDGSLDSEKCSVCHEADMSLSRSQVETCTSCHGTTPHAGAAEHLRATPASVARLLPPGRNTNPELPLTDAGGIFCGTCHFFHDPAVAGDEYLKHAWVPPKTGFAGTVADALAAHWPEIEHKYGESQPGAHLTQAGTKALRLPVSDGSLCRHCHTSVP